MRFKDRPKDDVHNRHDSLHRELIPENLSRPCTFLCPNEVCTLQPIHQFSRMIIAKPTAALEVRYGCLPGFSYQRNGHFIVRFQINLAVFTCALRLTKLSNRRRYEFADFRIGDVCTLPTHDFFGTRTEQEVPTPVLHFLRQQYAYLPLSFVKASAIFAALLSFFIELV